MSDLLKNHWCCCWEVPGAGCRVQASERVEKWRKRETKLKAEYLYVVLRFLYFAPGSGESLLQGARGLPRRLRSPRERVHHRLVNMDTEAPSEEFQENLRLAVASHLGLQNDTPMDEMVETYLALPQQTQLFILSSTMVKSKISPYDLILKECDSKRHLPLACVRDREDSPFCNLQCNACGKGKEAAGIDKFERCGRCKTVMYCNKRCQIRDWKGNGRGPTPLSHKKMCAELAESQQEFINDPVNGEGLRTHLFASWADQHHESGAFFRAEFLARRGLLGQSKVGFWAMASQSNPYAMATKDPTSGFYNGEMLFQSHLPSLKEGWKELKKDEFPSGPPNEPPPEEGIRSWEEYMRYRTLSTDSIAPILLTNVLTIYQMIRHELKLTSDKNKKIDVYLLGPEVELNHIPIFGELAYLLPHIDLTLKLVGPAVEGLCREARQNHPNSIIVRNDNTVLDVRHPNQEGRVRMQLVPDVEYYHEIPQARKRADAVLGLNVGLDAYASWMYTLANLFRDKTAFAFSDQTKIGLRAAEIVTFPKVIEGCKFSGNPHFSQITQPSVEIKLNPFHGVIGRDVSAVLVPNLDNGYLLVSKYA